MKIFFKITALFLIAAALSACKKEGQTEDLFTGKDNYIAAFSITADGIEYKASIVGDLISVKVPYTTNLNGAKASYVLSENATINPDPEKVTAWDEEWQFITTSGNAGSRVYRYTFKMVDITESGNVTLQTQKDVDNFKGTKINSIDGHLTIGTDKGDRITNLDGLSALESVSGSVIVKASFKNETLMLPSLRSAGSFKIGTLNKLSDNTDIQTVSLPLLSEVAGDLIIRSPYIKNIDLPELISVGETFSITSDVIASVTVNALTSVGDDMAVAGSTGTAAASVTEALIFPALSEVGGNITMEYLATLTSIYFPSLKTVDGMITFNYCQMLGGMSFPGMVASGGLTVYQCGALKSIMAPEMTESGTVDISFSTQIGIIDFSKLRVCGGDISLMSNMPLEDLKGFSSLETVNGTITFSSINTLKDISNLSLLKSVKGITMASCGFTAADLRGIDFNGGEFKVTSTALSSIKGDEEFNGSLNLFRGGSAKSVTAFDFTGFSTVKGDVVFGPSSSSSTGGLTINTLSLPFRSIRGNMEIGGGNNTRIEFPYLKEVEGNLNIVRVHSNTVKWSFENLQKIGKALNINTLTSACTVEFPELQSVGTAYSNSDNKTSTLTIGGQNSGVFSLPELETVIGTLHIKPNTNSYYRYSGIRLPKLQTVEALMITPAGTTSAYLNATVTSLDFSSLRTVNSIAIGMHSGLMDFSTFAYLFENNIINDSSGWNVSNCGYNPTYAQMKAGQYTP